MGNIIPSRTSSSLAHIIVLVVALLSKLPCAAAQVDSTPITGGLQECALGHPIWVRLPQSFENLTSENPSVLCIFRNKFEGFPTLNIVVEPRHDGTPPPSLGEYQEGIKRGYQSVGLSDATLSESIIGDSQGIPFFTSEVSFSNAGVAMKARILVLQLHDRTYTASAVGRAQADLPVLQELIRGIEVEGHPLDLQREKDAFLSTLATVIGVTFALLVAAIVRKRRHKA